MAGISPRAAILFTVFGLQFRISAAWSAVISGSQDMIVNSLLAISGVAVFRIAVPQFGAVGRRLPFNFIAGLQV